MSLAIRKIVETNRFNDEFYDFILRIISESDCNSNCLDMFHVLPFYT